MQDKIHSFKGFEGCRRQLHSFLMRTKCQEIKLKWFKLLKYQKSQSKYPEGAESLDAWMVKIAHKLQNETRAEKRMEGKKIISVVNTFRSIHTITSQSWFYTNVFEVLHSVVLIEFSSSRGVLFSRRKVLVWANIQ